MKINQLNSKLIKLLRYSHAGITLLKKLLLIFIISFLSQTYAEQNWQNSINIFGTANFSPITGYTQIPLGGSPGTSSLHRPKFSELSIHNTTFFDVGFNAQANHLGVFGEYQNDRPNGSTTLSQNLISHGIFIPAGTAVRTHTQFDLYTLGADYNFYFKENQLVLYPEVDVSMLAFAYRFNTPVVSSNRDFNSATVRLGAGLDYAFTERTSLSVNAATSIPVTNLNYTSAAADINYQFIRNHNWAAALVVGIGAKIISFKDGQRLSNHIQINECPIGKVGLRLLFN